jgi:peptide/nickel transport system permease protein
VSPEAERIHRSAFQADRPLPVRYLAWLEGLLSGNLGISFTHRRPVSELIRESAGNTLLLAGLALILQFVLGILAGWLAAATRRRWVDRLLTTGASVAYSLPSFWLALALVWLFAVRLGWLPVSQMHAVDAGEHAALWRWLDSLRHLILPCLALSLPAAGGIALVAREQVRSGLGRPYARAARARGMGRAALARQSLRGALTPLISLLGLSLPGILGGSVVLEVLFAWPGMGRLAYQAVLAKDEPLVLGCACVTALLVVAGSLIADLLAAWADPRVRESLV